MESFRSNVTKSISKIFFRLLRSVEKRVLRAQGKGYGADSINDEVLASKMFLPKMPELLIDIGGNIGNYSAMLRKSFPLSEIHIFEPAESNIKKLVSRFEADSLIQIVNLAISNTNSSTLLYSDRPGSGLSSLVKRRLDHFDTSFETTESVKTIRFEDYWLSKLQSKTIDLVKLDIEGHELQALQGFGKALRSINLLQFEFGGCNIDTRSFFQDFWYFFKDYSFDLHRITPFGLLQINDYHECDECFIATNYLAVRRKISSLQ
jgi:FkbM family methyltransferase